jgi:hypothetical protein
MQLPESLEVKMTHSSNRFFYHLAQRNAWERQSKLFNQCLAALEHHVDKEMRVSTSGISRMLGIDYWVVEKLVKINPAFLRIMQELNAVVAKPARSGHAPPDIGPKYVDAVEKLRRAKIPVTNETLAHQLGVSSGAVRKYLSRNPELITEFGVLSADMPIVKRRLERIGFVFKRSA